MAYGNDIDLFIQNNTGTFNWYALQAKVMSFNGAFKDLKHNKLAAIQQWDKLISHETNFGSKTYYLLYIGQSLRPPRNAPSRSDCLGIPTMDELGLGVVETKVVKNIRATIKKTQLVYFKHVFPNDIDSIRKLFCCTANLPQTAQVFQKSDIDTRGYQRIYPVNNNEINEDTNEGIEPIISENGKAPIRLIISIEQNASR